MKLTKRQLAVVGAIHKHANRHGQYPTIRELCNGLRIKSPNGVNCHLRILRELGVVEMAKGQARGVRLAGYRLKLVRDRRKT